MAVNRLKYHLDQLPKECESHLYIRESLDRNINESGTLHFQVPADSEAFTDTSEMYLKVELRVVKGDGSFLGADDKVFLVPGAIQSLFNTCSVAINNAPLPPVTDYSYVATLASYLGTSNLNRTALWGSLSGWSSPPVRESKVDVHAMPFFYSQIEEAAGSKLITLYGRITSDFLMSLAQYLPPNIKLDIVLTRARDSFALATDIPADYKIHLESASLFTKRVRLTAEALAQFQLAANTGISLNYNRITTTVQPIAEKTLVFRYNNVFASGPLPSHIYVCLVKQRSYYGSLGRLSNYLETANVRQVRMLLNSADILPEPLRCEYVYKDGESVDAEKSNALTPYMSLCAVLGNLGKPRRPLTLSYNEFLSGGTIYCCKLSSCSAPSQSTQGLIDLEVKYCCHCHFCITIIFRSSLNKRQLNLTCYSCSEKALKLYTWTSPCH